MKTILMTFLFTCISASVALGETVRSDFKYFKVQGRKYNEKKCYATDDKGIFYEIKTSAKNCGVGISGAESLSEAKRIKSKTDLAVAGGKPGDVYANLEDDLFVRRTDDDTIIFIEKHKNKYSKEGAEVNLVMDRVATADLGGGKRGTPLKSSQPPASPKKEVAPIGHDDNPVPEETLKVTDTSSGFDGPPPAVQKATSPVPAAKKVSTACEQFKASEKSATAKFCNVSVCGDDLSKCVEQYKELKDDANIGGLIHNVIRARTDLKDAENLLNNAMADKRKSCVVIPVKNGFDRIKSAENFGKKQDACAGKSKTGKSAAPAKK